MRLPRWWPGLCADRADVLAALALVARQREPLERGLARLAVGDPLLQTWSERLGPDLAGGISLGQVLVKHRLVTAEQGRVLDQATDIPAGIEQLTVEAAEPIPGLWLIRWFPVALVVCFLAPLWILSITGIIENFERIFREIGLTLPVLSENIIASSRGVIPEIILVITGSFLAMKLVNSIRIIRHLPHLWFPSVHRELALYDLLIAARTGHDEPRKLKFPWSWLAMIRLSSLRQDHPRWDESWRTFRFLTRWRSLGVSWKSAANATTAVSLLQHLGILDVTSTSRDIELRLQESRDRLKRHAMVALSQARGLMVVAVGIGIFLTILGLMLPLVMEVECLSSGTGSQAGYSGIGIATILAAIVLVIPQYVLGFIRLVFGLRTPGEYGLIFNRLAEATRKNRPWSEVLLRMRLVMPWPWPWRLKRIAEQIYEGTPPEHILAESTILPRMLRRQAVQALAMGPQSFAVWCEHMDASSRRQTRWSQHVIVAIFELLACLAVIHFIVMIIVSKFIQMIAEIETSIRFQNEIHFVKDLARWETPMLAIFAVTIIAASLGFGWFRWRSARRLQAGHLILRGTDAGLPEAALGTGDGFAAICRSAGWLATTPRELARAIQRAEWKLARRAAWLPAVVAALFPVVLAIPVGAMVIGIMRLLILLVYQVGDTP